MMLEARLGFETAGSNEGSASDSDANSQTLKGNDKKAKLSKAELFSQATVFLFAGK